MHILAVPEEVEGKKRFFKSGEGEYGYGDQFIGIRVPVLRSLVKTYRAMEVADIETLLQSPVHEERLLALFLLVEAYKRGNEYTKETVFDVYLANTRHVNNWDLVDSSAHLIVGAHLEKRNRALLYEFAHSESLWERRIAMMATMYFIRKGDFADTFALADVLLSDREDLIHKIVGWMLREVGERDREAEEAFLRARYSSMPRTMLRYAIEKFPKERREAYLRGHV